MATILSELFQGGTAPNPMTTANSTGFPDSVQPGWTYVTSPLIASTGAGTQAGRSTATGAGSVIAANNSITATGTVYFSAYINISTMPTGNTGIVQLLSGGVLRAELQLGVGGILRMRNSSSVAILTTASPNVLPLNSYAWLNWSYNNTTATQRLRLFTGGNLFGSTPSYDSGEISTTAAGTVTQIWVGTVVGTQTMTATWDRIIVDNATWPAAAPGTNIDPTASFTHSESGLTVTVNGSSSSDPDGTIASYDWDWGDGTTHGTGASTSHTYASAGTRTVTLTVTDNSGGTDSSAISITTTAPNSPPIANAGPDKTNVLPYSTITITGTDSDTDGTVVSRLWTGPAAVTIASPTSATTDVSVPGAIAGATYTMSYKVTDNLGSTNTDTMTIQVAAVTERAVIGGAEVPINMYLVSATAPPPQGGFGTGAFGTSPFGQ